MVRALRAQLLVLSLMTMHCSQVLLTEEPPSSEEEGQAGGAGGADMAMAGGSGSGEMPANPLVDTGTLSVAVSISAGNVEPHAVGQADAARVTLIVTVTERATWLPVTDAEVLAGADGALVSLPYNPYSASSYTIELVGYQPVWEFSIVRGSDRLEGLVVDGPSYSAASVVVEPAYGVIAWAPAPELGVTARICATTTTSEPAYAELSQHCVDSVDSGELFLDAAERDEMFPFEGAYWVVVERLLSQPTFAGEERSVGVFASMELVL